MKSKVLTKSLRGISQILTAFVCCCVLGFATTTSANAQNDYPLNVTVELTGVTHNLSDGLLDADPYYQIGGLTIQLDQWAQGDVFTVNELLLNRTISCAELQDAAATGLVTLPGLTAEEDDCFDLGCNSNCNPIVFPTIDS